MSAVKRFGKTPWKSRQRWNLSSGLVKKGKKGWVAIQKRRIWTPLTARIHLSPRSKPMFLYTLLIMSLNRVVCRRFKHGAPLYRYNLTPYSRSWYWDSVEICNFYRWDKIFRHKWSNLFLHWLGWMQKPPVVTEDMLEEREQFLAALYKSPSVSFLSMILEGWPVGGCLRN